MLERNDPQKAMLALKGVNIQVIVCLFRVFVCHKVAKETATKYNSPHYKYNQNL